MLKWREDYYVGEGIKDAAKARKRIDAGRMAFGVYLVTLSENPGNLLEIVPSYMLIQKSYYARCPEIVGMAKGKDEAGSRYCEEYLRGDRCISGKRIF